MDHAAALEKIKNLQNRLTEQLELNAMSKHEEVMYGVLNNLREEKSCVKVEELQKQIAQYANNNSWDSIDSMLNCPVRIIVKQEIDKIAHQYRVNSTNVFKGIDVFNRLQA